VDEEERKRSDEEGDAHFSACPMDLNIFEKRMTTREKLATSDMSGGLFGKIFT
jgi:hypothetical protein